MTACITSPYLLMRLIWQWISVTLNVHYRRKFLDQKLANNYVSGFGLVDPPSVRDYYPYSLKMAVTIIISCLNNDEIFCQDKCLADRAQVEMNAIQIRLAVTWRHTAPVGRSLGSAVNEKFLRIDTNSKCECGICIANIRDLLPQTIILYILINTYYC